MTSTLEAPTTLEPRASLDGWPPEEDRPIIRKLRLEVRQALGRLSGDDERGDPARVRQLIRECIEAHQRRAFSTTNTPRLIDAQAAERALVADFLGFGVLERYLQAPWVEEIGIVGPGRDWVWLIDGTKRPIDEIMCEDEADLFRACSGAWSAAWADRLPAARRWWMPPWTTARDCTLCSAAPLAVSPEWEPRSTSGSSPIASARWQRWSSATCSHGRRPTTCQAASRPTATS